MGRQDENFWAPEKAWLRVQVRTQVLRDVLTGGVKDKLTVATNIIWPLYQQTFPRPFPPETPEAFALRKRYARADRRKELTQIPGETEEDVEKRMNERFGVSNVVPSFGIPGAHIPRYSSYATGYDATGGQRTRSTPRLPSSASLL